MGKQKAMNNGIMGEECEMGNVKSNE